METPGPSAVSPPNEEPPAPPDQEPPAPVPAPTRDITQADIDAALQEWNGDLDSKRRVQQYMAEHGREKGTADWLRSEYGDDLPVFPVTVEGAAADLPWSKVQRHLARLVKEERFLTEEERGEAVAEKPAEDTPAQPTVREIYDRYKPIVQNLVLADVPYQNACRNSDKELAIIEGEAAVKRAALTITEPDFMRLYYDMPDFRYRMHREIVDETYAVLAASHEAMPEYDEETPPWGTEVGDHSPWGKVQESKKLAEGIFQISTPGHGGIMVRETDANRLLSPETISAGGIENGWCYFEEDAAAPIVIQELADKNLLGMENRPARDPLAPAYNEGDMVYLNGTAFAITDINLFEVQLRDPTQIYPIFRSESKDRFETLLRQDSRNSHITDFLAADLNQINKNFREVLTSGLLTDEDRGKIIEYFRAGKGNQEIGGLLSGLLGNRVDTMKLTTGETADYFTSGLSMRIEIMTDDEVKIAVAAYSWHEIAPVLRSLWQQELDGFSHAPVQQQTVHLEGMPSYQVGDKVFFPYGDHEISGTIGYIGDLDVRIDGGPYFWSNQTVTREPEW